MHDYGQQGSPAALAPRRSAHDWRDVRPYETATSRLILTVLV
jgi:hypothetical protein